MASYTLSLEEPPAAECWGGVLTIGNFDGVHLGHRALLQALKAKARSLNITAIALTFDPHPLQLLRPEMFQPVLTTVAQRAELLQEHGADHVLILKTTPQLLRLPPEEFFEQVIRSGLHARSLVEGDNFGFGHNREGNNQTLRDLARAAGMDQPVIVPAFLLAGLPVSSSRVRAALVAGKVDEATILLGRPYRIEGTVGSGQQRGQKLGFPTANLERVPTLVPADGVYAVRVTWAGASWAGAANIGPNPTFGEQARKVEVHLIDFQGDLYGQVIVVDFLQRLRDTRPFAGVDALIAQLSHDVDQARRLIAPDPEKL